MGNFDELGRQLGHTFTQLESAEGRAKRRWLRKAHLLLLLADEMAAEAEAEAAAADYDPPIANPSQQHDPHQRSALQALADACAAERGSCRGLQTVLILRKRANGSKDAASEARARWQ